MDTLPLITQIFGLIALGALIWLTIRAFKTSPGWGFAVLLLAPFSAAVFGVRYWEEQREPFLLYITTFTATFALCVYLFTVSGGLELLGMSTSFQRGMQPGTGRGNTMHTSYAVEGTPVFIDGSVTDEIASALDAETGETEVSEDEADAKQQEPVRYRLTYVPIKLSEAKNYVGVTAKIKRKNVREKEYRIIGVTPRHIELAQRSKGGQFSFRIKNSDIDNIRVLVNETY
ncbi:MAG: hypothetical protein JRG79_20725 [Deltaproteobacteria bacterium]|nr:hypothetical protein [Deltaproteobacteria bacterium]